MPSPSRKDGAAAALLILAALAAHAPELAFSSDALYFDAHLRSTAPDGVFDGHPGWNDPNVGVTTQALGGLAARQLLHRRMPWWNPYGGVGLPLAAEWQNSALFLPFSLILAVPGNSAALLKLCVQLIAGAATFALLRQMQLSRCAATVGGVLFELNGTFATVGHGPIMPIPFLPLLLFGIERTRATPTESRGIGWPWIVGSVTLALYAGFPETAFLNGLLGLAWTLLRAVQAPSGERLTFLLTAAGAAAAGVLLAMPVLLPFAELLARAYVGVHGTLSPPLAAAGYAMLLSPYSLGPIDYDFQWQIWPCGYLGLPIAFLASIAVRNGAREQGLRVLLAAWVVLALARSANLPVLTPLIDLIPGVRDVFFANYSVSGWEFAAIVLAAFALDDLARGYRRSDRFLALAASAWVGLLVLALVKAWPTVLTIWHDRPTYPWFLIGSLALTLATTALVTGVAAARRGQRRVRLLSAVMMVEAVILFAFPLFAGARTKTYDRALVGFLADHLGLNRFYSLGPFSANYGAYFALASLNHNYLPIPRIWVDYIHQHLDHNADAVAFTGDFPPPVLGSDSRIETVTRHLPAFEQVGVKFVLTPPTTDFAQPLLAAGLTQVYHDAVAAVWQMPAPREYFETRGGACRLSVVSRETVWSQCDAPAQLLRRELFFPVWRARVDDRDAKVTQTDEIFQSVALPAGAARIVFRYAPAHVLWAWSIAAVSLISVVTVAIRQIRMRSRPCSGAAERGSR